MKKRVKEWLNFSKMDLDSSLKLLEEPSITQSAAYHCHQTIEKSFKALLEHNNSDIPKTHDLEKLYGLVMEKGICLDIDEDVLDEVNDVYIESRYPSDLGLLPDGIPKVDTVKRFFHLAESIYMQISELLNKQ